MIETCIVLALIVLSGMAWGLKEEMIILKLYLTRKLEVTEDNILIAIDRRCKQEKKDNG